MKISLRCPHCSMNAHFEWNKYMIHASQMDNKGIELLFAQCPACDEFVIKKLDGKPAFTTYGDAYIVEVEKETMLFPKSKLNDVHNLIPSEYAEDFEEACLVLSTSKKASAALNRRLLQKVLREKFQIIKNTLSAEIDAFISRPGVPSHLADAIDAVRNIGNFAAHPLKDSNTGEIVDVESGEAEWLIEVMESLFDFAFIQPKKLEQRRKDLNNKLSDLGKPPLKNSKSDKS